MKKVYFNVIFCLFVFNSWSQEYKRMIAVGTYTVQEIMAEAKAHFAVVGTERGKGYKPYKRWEYQALRNCDENGRLKTPEFYFNELENYNNYLNQSNQSFRSSADVGNWEDLGPTYYNQTSGWNPGVGRITSIAVDKTNTNHIIVGGETGGVWKTLDNGTTWMVLTDNLSNLNVYALAIDPTNSSTYFWGSTNGNIFKSIDGGATWNLFSDTGNGVVNKILIDPTNTNKMYCSVEGGGIYKSINGGLNWTIINATATNGYDVEFKPNDTNIIYASGDNFYKSTDGGNTFEALSGTITNWTQQFVSGTSSWTIAGSNQNNTVLPKTGLGLGFFYIDNFSFPITKLVSPPLNLAGATNPQLKFSFTSVNWDGDIDELRVFYKTSVAGAWVQLAQYTNEETSWSDITLNLPNPSATYYIAFEGKSNFGRGVTLDDVSVKATNLGVIFTEGFESLTHQFSNGPKMIAVSEDNPSVVYVLEAANGLFGGLHKSNNSGTTFSKLSHPDKNYFGYSSFADDDRGQAPRDMDIAVNPDNVNEVHIAGILTWLSIDGGVNFNITSQWIPQNAATQNIGYNHCDIDIMEYIGDKLYVGSDGGISIAYNPTTVNSNYFTNITEGLGIRQFYKLGISQTNPVVVSGGSQDNGTSVYRTNGIWYDWLGADGMETFVDKNNSNIIYGTSQNGSLNGSTNGGNSAFGISTPDNKSGNWITPFEQDPIVANTLYTGYDQVYKSTNGGTTWTAISQNFGGNLDHLKIAPTGSTFMYAARGSNLYKKNLVGTNWSQLSGFSGSINSIAIHPTNPNKIAIATTGAQKVYVSTNGGVNWTSYLYDLPDFTAQALVWEDNDNDGLYVGMNYGVYYIDNESNNSWQPFSNNLPNVIISELEINYADNMLYAATYGRGLWRTSLFNPNLGVDEFKISDVKLFPNPASNEVTISWNTGVNVSVKIFDSLGKLVHFSTDVSLQDNYKINTSAYTSGMYFVRINSNVGVVTKKLIIE